MQRQLQDKEAKRRREGQSELKTSSAQAKPSFYFFTLPHTPSLPRFSLFASLSSFLIIVHLSIVYVASGVCLSHAPSLSLSLPAIHVDGDALDNCSATICSPLHLPPAHSLCFDPLAPSFFCSSCSFFCLQLFTRITLSLSLTLSLSHSLSLSHILTLPPNLLLPAHAATKRTHLHPSRSLVVRGVSLSNTHIHSRTSSLLTSTH